MGEFEHFMYMQASIHRLLKLRRRVEIKFVVEESIQYKNAVDVDIFINKKWKGSYVNWNVNKLDGLLEKLRGYLEKEIKHVGGVAHA